MKAIIVIAVSVAALAATSCGRSECWQIAEAGIVTNSAQKAEQEAAFVEKCKEEFDTYEERKDYYGSLGWPVNDYYNDEATSLYQIIYFTDELNNITRDIQSYISTLNKAVNCANAWSFWPNITYKYYDRNQCYEFSRAHGYGNEFSTFISRGAVQRVANLVLGDYRRNLCNAFDWIKTREAQISARRLGERAIVRNTINGTLDKEYRCDQ